MTKTYNNHDEISLLFKRFFDSEDGKDVLSILDRQFNKPALVPNAAVDGQAMTNMTNIRIGEQNFYKFIEAMINRDLSKSEPADKEE